MTLRDLQQRLPGSKLAGDGSIQIEGIAYDSRQITSGNLFCALPGEKVDGTAFIPAALDRGAAAVLTEDWNALPAGISGLIVENARKSMAQAAHALFGDPTASLALAGITGTNGKTTCTHILQSIFNAGGGRAARIGTIGWEFEGKGEPLERTTPEAPDLLALLAKLKEANASHVALEVTSIAVPMHRIEGFDFDGVLFTNLTQDHLDLHGSMEHYFAAKHRLFLELGRNTVAVSNLDDEHGEAILIGVRGEKFTFGFERPDADVRGELLVESPQGLGIRVSGRFGDFDLRSPYIGRFNASNVLGCVTLALAMGEEPDAVADGVLNAPQVRGRMERLLLDDEVTAVIDYAHTPDALRRALEALRPMTPGRLIVVMGAGGERDPGKRPVMGRIAAEFSDLAYITSDNPRSEDPESIVEQIFAGVAGGNVHRVVSRRDAIRAAIGSARGGDVVLIAGKGHETYQEIKGVRQHFDDREEVFKLRRTASC